MGGHQNWPLRTFGETLRVKPMREWYAIFEGSPNNEPELVEGDVSGPDFGEFAAAADVGKVGNRTVKSDVGARSEA